LTVYAVVDQQRLSTENKITEGFMTYNISLIGAFQSLMDGLKEVNADLWRDVTDLQAHWIGSCDGVRFEFKLMVCSLCCGLYYLACAMC